MNKSIGWAILITLGTACSYAQAKDEAVTSQETYKIDGREIELARYAKALIGNDNVTVEIAPYKKGMKQGAILLFHGIEGNWDGKAVNHDVTPAASNGQNYVTTFEGKNWTTIVMRNGEDGKPKYELHVPGTKDVILLAPSDGAAQLTNPRKIFDEYQKQKSQK